MCDATDTAEEAMLKQALEMSTQPAATSDVPAASSATTTTSSTPAISAPERDFSDMSEEEQIAYAMQLSMAADSGEWNNYVRGWDIKTRLALH